MKYKVHLVGSDDEQTIVADSSLEAALIFEHKTSMPHSGWVIVDGKDGKQFQVRYGKVCEDIEVVQPLEKSEAELEEEKTNSELERAIQRKKGLQNMLFGALWCIGGTIFTVVSYNAASSGGTYVVTWGAILFGGIQFIKGFFELITA